MPTVVITGAKRGIGLEMARQYIADGWTVIAGVREPAGAEKLRALGADVRALDVADPVSIKAFADGFAGTKIDLLINNAGVIGPDLPAQSAEHIDVEAWLETMKVNALAPVLVAQAMKPHLVPGAKIATLSSVLGSITENTGGYVAYRASKAAVNMGIHCLSLAWGKEGLTLLLLHPGWVQTEMGGPNAPVLPTDSAAGLRQVIASATAADNGAYIAYDGRRIPW